ncbi:MAG TPA: M67 family metallopeptidase [Herpetosiphonaceae bacterium]
MQIQRRHINAMLVAAAGSSAEICGVLLGRRAPQMVVHGIVPGHNLHPEPRRHFLLDAQTLLQADAQARAAGDEILGFYHSHPSGGALPSPHDRRDAWPGYVYLIIAVERGAPRYLCAWICQPDGALQPEPIQPCQESDG